MTAITAEPKKRSAAGLLLRAIFVWPVLLLWKVATAVEKRLGIFPTLLVGGVMVAVGLFLCGFLLGIPLGLPMTVLGAAFLLRALY